jgi:hypothetical protein
MARKPSTSGRYFDEDSDNDSQSRLRQTACGDARNVLWQVSRALQFARETGARNRPFRAPESAFESCFSDPQESAFGELEKGVK